MTRYISIILFISLFSCKKDNLESETKSSCLLEKTTEENGTIVNTFTYDSKSRVKGFTASNTALNFEIIYYDAKASARINNKIHGQIDIQYSKTGNIETVKARHGDLTFTCNGSNVSQISIIRRSLGFNYTGNPMVFRFDYQDGNIKKVIMSDNGFIKDRLTFEGLEYDNKKNIYPKEMREYLLISTILLYSDRNFPLDFSNFSKNNILSKNSIGFTSEQFENQKYSYLYNSKGYPTQVEYEVGLGRTVIYKYSYNCP